VGGLSLTNRRGNQSGERTVILFDASVERNGVVFVGGTGHAMPPIVLTYLHEFGHLLGAADGLQNAFNSELQVANLPAVTPYAGSRRAQEYFPEAFALYCAERDWLQENHPRIHAWMHKRMGSH
jgi:hypothetical protein